MAATHLLQSRSNQKLQGADTLRVVATLAVILIHVAMGIIDQKPDPSTIVWWTVNLFMCIARWCVPVFVLLSGALLLDPAKDQTTALFYRRRIRRIGGALVFWSVGYLTMDIFVGKPMGIRVLIWRVLTGTPYYHLWFVYMIAGLYVVTPVLRIFVKHASDAQRWGLVALLLVLSVGHDAFEALTWDQESPFVLTRFVPYLGYYLCGYQLRILPISKFKAWPLRSVAVACIILMMIGSYFLLQWFGWYRSRYLYGYCSPLVMVSSLAIFLWAIKSHLDFDESHFLARFVGHLAPCTLGIYLIHPLVLGVLGRIGFDAQQIFVPLGIPLLTAMVFAISYGAVVVARQIPLLRLTL